MNRNSQPPKSTIIYLKCNRRVKDGKEHRYWSILESRRYLGGRIVPMRPERSKPVAIRGIGPDLVYARLWKESGILEVLRSVLKARQYEFDVERAIFVLL